jgi:hypothetical protein
MRQLRDIRRDAPIAAAYKQAFSTRIAFFSKALIIERAVASASSRVPETSLSFGMLSPPG